MNMHGKSVMTSIYDVNLVRKRESPACLHSRDLKVKVAFYPIRIGQVSRKIRPCEVDGFFLETPQK